MSNKKFGGGDMMAFQSCEGHVDWVCRARRAGFYWPFGGLRGKKSLLPSEASS